MIEKTDIPEPVLRVALQSAEQLEAEGKPAEIRFGNSHEELVMTLSDLRAMCA